MLVLKIYNEQQIHNLLQTRLDFMQLMLNAHKEPNDENQEDKEHDKEFKEVYKGVVKRGKFSIELKKINGGGVSRNSATTTHLCTKRIQMESSLGFQNWVLSLENDMK